MDNQGIEDRRRAGSYLVFVGWLAALIAAFGVIVLLTPGRTPLNCQSTGFGSCWSDRDRLVLLGWILGIPGAGIEFVVGLLVTAAYNRAGWASFWTGTAAFFASLPLAAVAMVVMVVVLYR
ncbi:hypothetical protein [Kribbella sp. NPDC055071]